MTNEELRQRLAELLLTDNECDKDGHGDCSRCEYRYANDKCAKYLTRIIVEFLIANGVTIRERGGWIPVTERLPEGREPLLVTDGRQVKISYRNHFYKENGSGKIRVPANYGNGMYVTHWMPLPEPPESEKGGAE